MAETSDTLEIQMDPQAYSKAHDYHKDHYQHDEEEMHTQPSNPQGESPMRP